MQTTSYIKQCRIAVASLILEQSFRLRHHCLAIGDSSVVINWLGVVWQAKYTLYQSSVSTLQEMRLELMWQGVMMRYCHPWLHLPREYNKTADHLSNYDYGTNSVRLGMPLQTYAVV